MIIGLAGKQKWDIFDYLVLLCFLFGAETPLHMHTCCVCMLGEGGEKNKYKNTIIALDPLEQG